MIITFDLSETNFLDLKNKILDLKIEEKLRNQSSKISIPICCEDEYALDMERLQNKLNKTKSDIIKIFVNKTYFCYMTGFVAGMPFLGDLDQEMRLKRLETPRVKVPKGSVGITEQFCNIYSFETPGGWNILGNTPQNIFDTSNQSNPNLVNPGDTIKFYRITLDKYNEIKR